MSLLTDLPGSEPISRNLRGTTGYSSSEDFAEMEEDPLPTTPLKKPSPEPAGNPSSQGEITSRITHQREMSLSSENPANTETSPASPTTRLAIPLPARVLVGNRIRVAEIPPAFPLHKDQSHPHLQANPEISGPDDLQPAKKPSRRKIDISRLRPLDDLTVASIRMPASASSPAADRVMRLRAPLPETNAGKNPNSRRYIRGVLHTHPRSIHCAAWITLLLVMITPLAILSSALLLLSRELPEKFSWSPQWLLIFPIAFPVLGIAWLLWGHSGKCRICGIKLFVHRTHLKNSKAHHLPLLGYVVPLCVHILLFRWFRCTHCGTPVRLKP